MLKSLAEYLKKNWPPNRVVVLLTPILFVPAAGWVTVKAAQLGLTLDNDQVVGAFVAGGLAAITMAYKFLTGWQAYEAQIADPMKKPILAPGHQDPPPVKKEGGEPLPPGESGLESGLDGDALLSQPDDISESDSDDPDLDERVEREQTERPQ